MMHACLPFIFIAQRFVASAKAGTWLSPFRKRVTFRARVIDQDGTGLLMPSDDNLLGLIMVQLCALSVALGAGIALVQP